MKILTIGKNDAGQRLDKFLSKAVKGLPTTLMYKFIRTKKIKVNRARTAQNYILCEGDEIQLFIRDEFFDSPEKDDGALSRITPKLDIVYEDENIMLLNKRPGVLVHNAQCLGVLCRNNYTARVSVYSVTQSRRKGLLRLGIIFTVNVEIRFDMHNKRIIRTFGVLMNENSRALI